MGAFKTYYDVMRASPKLRSSVNFPTLLFIFKKRLWRECLLLGTQTFWIQGFIQLSRQVSGEARHLLFKVLAENSITSEDGRDLASSTRWIGAVLHPLHFPQITHRHTQKRTSALCSGRNSISWMGWLWARFLASLRPFCPFGKQDNKTPVGLLWALNEMM